MRMKKRSNNKLKLNSNNNNNNVTNNKKQRLRRMILCATAVIVCCVIIGLYYDGTTIILSTGTIDLNTFSLQQQQQPVSTSASSSLPSTSSSSLLLTLDYEVSTECKNLPFIRPMGTYFLDPKIKMGSSPGGVVPSFNVGSNFGSKVTYHMIGDKPHFQLIKEVIEKNKSKKGTTGGGLVLDIGANQGFFTWYLASLGMDVHSFEIYDKNVIALQHGSEYNPPNIASNVNIYPVGLGQYIGRMNMGGSNYDGHLRTTNGGQGTGGTILSSTLDCFVYHNLNNIGNDLVNNISFIKLDVEGFEIDVILGGSQTIFNFDDSKKNNIGGMLMEVGPSRWERGSNITFEKGLQVMKNLSTKFLMSYVIIRTSGGHASSCPKQFATNLKDQNPRILDNVQIHIVEYNEWESLLQMLLDNQGDCNFWYTN